MYNYFQYLTIVFALIIFTKINMKYRLVLGGYVINLGWYIEWLIFTLLASFRVVQGEYGGADAQNYIDCFLYGYEYSSEKLFYLIGRIIRFFTDNYHVYFMFIYGVIVASILSFAACVLNEGNKKRSIAVLFLFFNMYVTSFGVMRQWLAIAVGMLAIVAVKKEHKVLGTIMLLIAGLIHFAMLPLFFVLIVYFVVFKIKKLKLNNVRTIPKKKFQVGLICNLIAYAMAPIFVTIISQTEYAAYVSSSVLEAVSWFGYLPTIVAVALMVYYESCYNTSSFEDLMLFFLFAHFATVYIMVGLGMFRLMVCFFAIRVWGISYLKEALNKRFKMKYRPEIVNAVVELMIFADGLIYMWRTVGNGALPLILPI